MDKTTPYDLGVQAFAEFKEKFPMLDSYFRKEYLKKDYEVTDKFDFFGDWLEGYSSAEWQMVKKLSAEFEDKKGSIEKPETVNIKKKNKKNKK